jgi:hypothetical protein
VSLIAWGDAWEPNAWALYTWEDDGLLPEEEEQPGSGLSRRARTAVRLKRYPTPEQVTVQPRDVMIEEIAARRTTQFAKPKPVVPMPPGLPAPVQEIIAKAAAMPWPALSERAVKATPGGAAKWSKREQLELRAARVKFQERVQAKLALARYEAQLQDELTAAARRELDIVFVAAMMALTDED